MLESGVFVRDHVTRLEEIQLKDSGMMLKTLADKPYSQISCTPSWATQIKKKNKCFWKRNQNTRQEELDKGQGFFLDLLNVN